MFSRFVVAAALILSSGVALASDASYDQRQARDEQASAAPKQEARGAAADRTDAGCSCAGHQHRQ